MSDFHFDFAVALTVLTVVTGIGWALDKWWLAPARNEALAPGQEDKPGWFIEFCAPSCSSRSGFRRVQ